MEFEPVIQEKLRSLCQHFTKARESAQALELHAAFLCFAADTVSAYTYGATHCFKYLDKQTLTDDWKRKGNGAVEVMLLARHFPVLYNMAHIVPLFVARLFSLHFGRFGGTEKVSTPLDAFHSAAFNRGNKSKSKRPSSKYIRPKGSWKRSGKQFFPLSWRVKSYLPRTGSIGACKTRRHF